MTSSILQSGRNCWKKARADRFGVIFDAEDYFVAVKQAILEARQVVYLIGWDFDTRIEFEPEGASLEGPNKLGRFLKWIGKTRPDLQVHILKWHLGLFTSLGRGSMPFRLLNLMSTSNIHFKLDGAHPPASAHHQKIVVIDDVLAFCGGIDITTERWDTRWHLDDDARRKMPNGKPHGPWHDATSVLSGPVAKLLGDVARERWFAATSEKLLEPNRSDPLWPEAVQVLLRDVEVAIARTLPAYRDQSEVREIETLYLDAIAGAKDIIYCESQYFASRRIAEAMAARLQEPAGPEIIVINPESADGYLEAKTMDTARARLLQLVGAADRHDRFRIFTPVTEQGRPIYVHAKITIIDDRLLRVGSSNFNNRSLGFDSECDVAIEVPSDDRAGATASVIETIRTELLAEHLATEPHAIRDAIALAKGSFVKAIDRLLGPGKTLRPYVPDEVGAFEEMLAENDLLDPESPRNFFASLTGGSWRPEALR
ncbi:MAG: phospholipase D-like domain-containing protein [Allorhizobium sp.]